MLLRRTVSTAVAVLILCISCTSAGVAEQAAPVLTIAEYAAQLEALIAATDSLSDNPEKAPLLAAALPSSWTVSDGGTSFQVSAEWLKTELLNVKDGKSESLKELRTRLAAMRVAAQSSNSEARDFATERAAIDGILARSEFRHVHGPTWWDRLKQRVFHWIVGVLSRIFGSSAVPTVTRVIVWTLVAVAVILLALSIYRTMRRNARLESLAIDAPPVSAKEWSAYMADASAAAARGDWREAIHMAYWAGISLLERRGTWRPDRARTPREYLRLLPSHSDHRPALTALTQRFEVVWYGYSPADEQAYADTLAEVEKLGCD